MATTVFAKLVHLGEDYATIELEVQVVDSKNPKNTRPKIEVQVPRGVGDWFVEKADA